MALVAIAGPATNVLLATVSALLFHVLGSLPANAAAWVGQTLYQSIVLNLLLAIFNLLPIPPLDGSRIALAAMPAVLARPYAKLQRFGFLILVGLVFLLPMLGRELGLNLNLFGWLVGIPLARVLPGFKWLAGI